ncbi:Uncharacterized protein TSPI_07833 [Trichinella spiralis]|uniref:Uncharacterized protein n=1 Tax=Trichinella spiralis TaxID=6334 RepID=A0ABR3KZP8_TRISP
MESQSCKKWKISEDGLEFHILKTKQSLRKHKTYLLFAFFINTKKSSKSSSCSNKLMLIVQTVKYTYFQTSSR